MQLREAVFLDFWGNERCGGRAIAIHRSKNWLFTWYYFENNTKFQIYKFVCFIFTLLKKCKHVAFFFCSLEYECLGCFIFLAPIILRYNTHKSHIIYTFLEICTMFGKISCLVGSSDCLIQDRYFAMHIFTLQLIPVSCTT